MRRVLLTGFEPFGGAAENPSRLAVFALAADPPPGVALFTAILPVTHAGAWPALHAALLRHAPDILIATGLAGGRAEIAVERVAVNLDNFPMPDNAGEQRVNAPVLQGGPATYLATLPLNAITAAMRAAGVRAQMSESAGAFLCNHVFYRACHWAVGEGTKLRVGFLHLPWLPAQALAYPAAPSMALATMVVGLRAALAAVNATDQFAQSDAELDGHGVGAQAPE